MSHSYAVPKMISRAQAIPGALTNLLDRLASREKVALILLFFLALVVRAVYIGRFVGFASPPVYDEIGYDLLATSMLQGHGFVLDITAAPTASRVPGYPLFLALLYGLFGHHVWVVRLVQAILGSFTCLLIYALAKSVANRRVGLLAALAASFYPLFLYMGGLLYSETLALLLLVAALYLFTTIMKHKSWARALFAGILLAASVLTNPLGALLIPILLVGLLMAQGWRDGFRYGIVLSLGALLVLTPWVVRNFVVFDRFIPLSSLAGSNLWSGNNPLADGGFVYPNQQTWPGENSPDREYLGWASLGEADSSSRFAQEAIEWIANNPAQFLGLLPKKLLRLWSPTMYGRQFSRYAPTNLVMLIAPPYVLFLITAFYGILLARRFWPLSLPLYAAVVSCNLVALIYYGATRYSISMAPSLLIFAALAVDHLLLRPANSDKKGKTI